MSKVCTVYLKKKVEVQVEQGGGRIIEVVHGPRVDDIRDTVQIHHAVFSEICLPYLLDCLRSRKKWGRALWKHYLLDIYLWVGINGFTVWILYIEKTQRD